MSIYKKTLEKTEGEIKNEQSRETGNIAYTRHSTKTNKNKKHNMCWTPSYTRQKTKINNNKNTTQYMLDTIIHKTQDEDKQNKK